MSTAFLTLPAVTGCEFYSPDIEGTELAGRPSSGEVGTQGESAPSATGGSATTAAAPANANASAAGATPAPSASGEVLIPTPTQPSGPVAPVVRDAYYAVVFAAESTTGDPSRAHTFASFVHVRAPFSAATTNLVADSSAATVEERVDISWLPDGYSGQVTTPYCGNWGGACFWVGANLSLEKTIDLMQRTQKRVVSFGPREITSDAFARARSRRDILASGRVSFLPVDSSFHRQAYEGTGGAENAVHAVSDVGDYLLGDVSAGKDGAQRAIGAFGPAMQPRDQSAEWLLPRLGVSADIGRAD